MKTHKGKRLVLPRIKPVFEGRFPKGHVNDVKGWNFTKAELQQAAKDGRMLAIDLDMAGGVKCSLRCKHCFNPVKELKRKGHVLSDEQVFDVVREAKGLGLRSVKIIGPGEPLEVKILLPFLEFLVKNGIQPLIFTKGTALGDDRIARHVHGMDSVQLIAELDPLGVTILFGLNSFNPELQAEIVGRKSYPKVRNLALERLADAGFNSFTPGEPTRLSLIPNPILANTVDEAVMSYKWARRRHIYTIASPSMVSGSCSSKEVLDEISPTEEELLDVYTRVNLWAIRNNIYSLEDIEEYGLSVYVGVQPCQQLAIGLFIRRDGLVLRCPGDDVSVQGHYPEHSLADIWQDSENLKVYAGRNDYGCPPKDGKSFPLGFIERVLERVKAGLA